MSSLHLRRGTNLLAAAALAAGGLAVVPGAAAAPAGAQAAVVNAALAPAAVTIPDASTTGTLHITKYQQGESVGSAGNGLRQSVTGTPIEGVEFTATQLDVDLSTQAGWEELAALGGSTTKAASHKTQSTFTGTTDSSGVATIGDLPVAAYLVSETSYPGNVTPSQDFIVTIPMTDPTNLNRWLYDVYV